MRVRSSAGLAALGVICFLVVCAAVFMVEPEDLALLKAKGRTVVGTVLDKRAEGGRHSLRVRFWIPGQSVPCERWDAAPRAVYDKAAVGHEIAVHWFLDRNSRWLFAYGDLAEQDWTTTSRARGITAGVTALLIAVIFVLVVVCQLRRLNRPSAGEKGSGDHL